MYVQVEQNPCSKEVGSFYLSVDSTDAISFNLCLGKDSNGSYVRYYISAIKAYRHRQHECYIDIDALKREYSYFVNNIGNIQIEPYDLITEVNIDRIGVYGLPFLQTLPKGIIKAWYVKNTIVNKELEHLDF